MSEMKGTRTVDEIVGEPLQKRPEQVIELGEDRMYVRKDSERSVTIGPGLVIDPFRVSTWPPEQQRNHRLRRALHELLASPAYSLEVGTKPDGSPGVRIRSEYDVTPEAAAFLRTYREEFITYLSWLEQVDAYSGVAAPVEMHERKAA